jgi:hypothetical protein
MVTTFRGSALKQILVYEDCISQPNRNVENPDNSDLLQLNQPARHKSSENNANKTQVPGLGLARVFTSDESQIGNESQIWASIMLSAP